MQTDQANVAKYYQLVSLDERCIYYSFNFSVVFKLFKIVN